MRRYDLCDGTAIGAAAGVRGAYAIAIRLDAPLDVVIGGRPAATLAPGRYIYCGSANGSGGIASRVGRHLRRGKTIRWHVDQLTEHGAIETTWIFPGGSECRLVSALSFLPAPIAGFGSSDCRRCHSHLLAWSDEPLPWVSSNARP